MDRPAADLCARCASIPWDHLEQDNHSWHWVDEKPTLGDLQTSSCRLCRLITSAILARPVQNAHLRSVVKMWWNRKPEIVNSCPGSMKIFTNSGHSGFQFSGKLILTTGDVTAWSTAAPKRVNFAQVRPGLEACKASHKSCEPANSLLLHNLRVIDCIRGAVVMAPTACSFVALSYVWGELSADDYVLGSQIALPPTIEDAVKSTRALGYQYLWVDRYCIKQGDPSDKEEQISQMGWIYASAQLTIVAAAGVDPSYGLAGISSDRKAMWVREPVGSSRLLCMSPDAAQDYIAQSTWFSRAWTLQEGYLSKRILCFTEREAVFTCKSGCSWTAESTPDAYEMHHSSYEQAYNKKNVETGLSSRIVSLGGASNIMETYSTRLLGHQSDKLNAVIGILSVLNNGHPPIYHIWGVPFTFFRGPSSAHSADSTVFISLHWYHLANARRLPEFPSWSTIGWIGQVEHSGEPAVTPHFMIKYWSGERYQELDNGTCDLDYTFCRDVTHRSQYLEITTDVVQVELHSRARKKCTVKLLFNNDTTYYVQPTFVRAKEVRDQKEVWPKRRVRPFLRLNLDAETISDVTLPVVCAMITSPEINPHSWSSFWRNDRLLLVFQQKANIYERIAACQPNVYTIDKEGEYVNSDHKNWEFVPRGEPGAWDQVAERRTFLLG